MERDGDEFRRLTGIMEKKSEKKGLFNISHWQWRKCILDKNDHSLEYYKQGNSRDEWLIAGKLLFSEMISWSHYDLNDYKAIQLRFVPWPTHLGTDIKTYTFKYYERQDEGIFETLHKYLESTHQSLKVSEKYNLKIGATYLNGTGDKVVLLKYNKQDDTVKYYMQTTDSNVHTDDLRIFYETYQLSTDISIVNKKDIECLLKGKPNAADGGKDDDDDDEDGDKDD